MQLLLLTPLVKSSHQFLSENKLVVYLGTLCVQNYHFYTSSNVFVCLQYEDMSF